MKKMMLVVALISGGVTVWTQQPSIPAAPDRGQGRGRGQAPRVDPLVVDDRAGFEPIFDGTSLNGWDGDKAFWRVENGTIVGQSTPQNVVKQNTFLIWRGGEPRNFELKVQFRMDSTNSGIQIRSTHLPAGTQIGDAKVENNWVMKGYQPTSILPTSTPVRFTKNGVAASWRCAARPPMLQTARARE
jgi:hypothetical protein